MPSYTNFLNLSLPALSEFVDSWNEPLNQNFEDIDDWMEDLHASLVGAGVGSTWASLRGNLANLADRLVSIDADGNIDVSSSADILDMSTSAYHGQTSPPSPRDRLNRGDEEVYAANQPFANGRFTPTGSGGPAAGEAFPHADLDAGMAIRSADFSGLSPVAPFGPPVPWAPGLILGGADPFITATANAGEVQLNGLSSPAIFNIDGYVFRFREDLIFDYSNIDRLAINNYVWLYVDRAEANYGDSTFLYKAPGPNVAVARDLRILKEKITSPDGITAVSTFSSAAGTFDSAPGSVKEGDILRIPSGSAAGDYVIDVLDGSTPNTKFTIKGIFKADLGGVPYQIIDNSMPNFGAVIADSNPALPESLPPSVAGRVYIGRVLHLNGVPPSPRVTFARGGVWDSGWLPAATLTFPKDFAHALGANPSRVEVWVRETGAPADAYKPLVLRQVVTNLSATPTTGPGDVEKVSFLLPSIALRSDELRVKVDLLNASVDPLSPVALFTKNPSTAPSDIVAADGDIRVIAWR